MDWMGAYAYSNNRSKSANWRNKDLPKLMSTCDAYQRMASNEEEMRKTKCFAWNAYNALRIRNRSQSGWHRNNNKNFPTGKMSMATASNWPGAYSQNVNPVQYFMEVACLMNHHLHGNFSSGMICVEISIQTIVSWKFCMEHGTTRKMCVGFVRKRNRIPKPKLSEEYLSAHMSDLVKWIKLGAII